MNGRLAVDRSHRQGDCGYCFETPDNLRNYTHFTLPFPVRMTPA